MNRSTNGVTRRRSPRSARSAAPGRPSAARAGGAVSLFRSGELSWNGESAAAAGWGAGPASTRRNPRYLADESELMKELAAAAETCCAAQKIRDLERH